MEETACWADSLSRKERRLVAEFLARACQRFFDIRHGALWIEMADLHLDVTERAEVAAS
jgi:hypothetical protein